MQYVDGPFSFRTDAGQKSWLLEVVPVAWPETLRSQIEQFAQAVSEMRLLVLGREEVVKRCRELVLCFSDSHGGYRARQRVAITLEVPSDAILSFNQCDAETVAAVDLVNDIGHGSEPRSNAIEK